MIAFNNLINFAPIQLLVKKLQYGEIIAIFRERQLPQQGVEQREQGSKGDPLARQGGFEFFESLVLGLLKVPGCALTVSKPCKTLLPR